jgi:hypothetical protein
MTKRRGLLKGKGPLPREKAVVGAAGTLFPSTTALSIDNNRFRAKAKKSQALSVAEGTPAMLGGCCSELSGHNANPELKEEWIWEMAQMCALCALGFLLEELFGSGGLLFRRLGVFVIGGGPECGEGTAAGDISKSG